LLRLKIDTYFYRTVRYGQALFHRINQWCKQHHVKLLVITTGFNAFYPNDIHDPTKVFLEQAKSFFSSENIAYNDSSQIFKQAVAGKNIQIPGDQHPNELGAKIIAQINWPWIKEQIKHPL